jgi:DNA end-binding protein Ku
MSDSSYADNLRELIKAKAQGKEIVAPPAEEAAQVINLMEALRKSVAQVEAEQPAKPPKRAAKSMPKKPEAEKKRKKSS